jgi:hypothetical protein
MDIFEKAERKIREHFKSFDVISPTKLGLKDGDDYEYCMKVCLDALRKCHYMIIIDDYDGNWKKSEGVKREIAEAGKHNIKIIHLSVLGAI